jgi:hypothetical protein
MSNSNPLSAAGPPVGLSTINVVLEPDYEAIVSQTRVPRLRRTDYDGLVYEPGTTALTSATKEPATIVIRAPAWLLCTPWLNCGPAPSDKDNALEPAALEPAALEPAPLGPTPSDKGPAPSDKGPQPAASGAKTSLWPSVFD